MPEERTSPQPIKFPLGIDNRSREYELPLEALRECENLDVTRGGGLISRPGLREVMTGNFHSPFVHPNQKFMLVVKDGYLCKVEPDELVTQLIDVVGDVQYAVLNSEIYWTDGYKVGRCTNEGALAMWGLNKPPPPLVQVVSDGGFIAGTYSIAMTAIDSEGVESPASDVISITLAAGQGFEIVTPTAAGVNFAIYRTTADGPVTELRRALVVAPGTTFSVSNGYLGKLLESLYAERPVPGQCLTQYKGRLWVASETVLWFTSELSPHWLYPATGFYLFESPILVLQGVEDGIYVGLAERMYFLQGSDPIDMTQRPVSSEGAIFGSGADLPYDLFLGSGSFPSRQCMFLDSNGFLCIGKPGGIIVRPTAARYSLGKVEYGTLTYCDRDGLRQVVASVSTQDGALLAKDQPIREVFSNGVVLNA